MGSGVSWLLVSRPAEEESLEKIKDAIQEYLETVDELSKDKESRNVEVGDILKPIWFSVLLQTKSVLV